MRSRAQISSHPIHPMLVVFPIGLFIGGWIFDLIGSATNNELLWAASYYCVIAGLVGGFCAAIAGTIDWATVVPPRSSGKRRGLLHGCLNALVLAAFIIIAVNRGDPIAQPHAFELGLMTAAIVLLGISGWLGGTLAYRNQIGVDHRYASAGKWRERDLESWERPACNQSELSEGQMMLLRVGKNKERVVLGRCPEGMVAFSDHCTHKGGGLSDGALVGCTVQCPWHGSQFDVHTGRVVAGPAGSKIEVYETEIRAGEVYVSVKKNEPSTRVA
ncbi:MAG TPA: DUF2231 domain-containing protein [Terriglobales bacterium]|nr:DUF2231 domain-containing protein [Terriglobales bacterium]